MHIPIIFEDENLLVADKPAGIVVFPEGEIKEKTLIDCLIEAFPKLKDVGQAPRYGVIHRLDKDTSGILLIAKNNYALPFFQKQFKQRKVIKKYLALVVGKLNEKEGVIKTLIARDKKGIKQRACLLSGPESRKVGPRTAQTEWRVIKNYKNYTLLEILPKTGRKHQIRVHLAHLGHPVVGDKMYSFKNPLCPRELSRQFLHASELTIQLPDNKDKKFNSDLPEDLRQTLKNL